MKRHSLPTTSTGRGGEWVRPVGAAADMRRRPPSPLLPGAEVDGRRDERAHVGRDLYVVATAERVDAQQVDRGLAAGDRGLRGEARGQDLRARAGDADVLGLVAAVDGDGVG